MVDLASSPGIQVDWPKAVLLRKAKEFPAVVDGKVVGKMMCPGTRKCVCSRSKRGNSASKNTVVADSGRDTDDTDLADRLGLNRIRVTLYHVRHSRLRRFSCHRNYPESHPRAGHSIHPRAQHRTGARPGGCSALGISVGSLIHTFAAALGLSALSRRLLQPFLQSSSVARRISSFSVRGCCSAAHPADRFRQASPLPVSSQSSARSADQRSQPEGGALLSRLYAAVHRG